MEDYFTINEVCKMLRITRQTLYNWEKEGKIKFSRVNGLPRIQEIELKRITKGE